MSCAFSGSNPRAFSSSNKKKTHMKTHGMYILQKKNDMFCPQGERAIGARYTVWRSLSMETKITVLCLAASSCSV